MRMKPWMIGPTELLRHALEHLKRGTPFDCRISLISVDNAVELTIKTYLGLPKRIRRSDGPSRKRLKEASASFPDLLDLLEGYSSEQQADIELGEIEWYHRLRNTLYHDGSGITVDPDKVDSYLQIAKILCHKLLGIPFEDEFLVPQSELGDLVAAWGELEEKTRQLHFKHFPGDEKKNFHNLINAFTQLVKAGVISREVSKTIDSVCKIRNEAVYGSSTPDTKILKETTKRVLAVVKEIGDL